MRSLGSDVPAELRNAEWRMRKRLASGPYAIGARYETIEEMQTVLDAYMVEYNTRRPHQGRGTNGRTSAEAFGDGITGTTRRTRPT